MPFANRKTLNGDSTDENRNISFGDNGYVESDAVKMAKHTLDNLSMPTYQSQHQPAINDVLNKLKNREKFSYDVNGDALYQQYKDKFIQNGKMAMQDAIGQASMLTGGYGNSYASMVGSQAYQASLREMNDVIPELYQLAYDKYRQEDQDIINRYSVLSDMENQDYSRHRDSVANYKTDRDYYTDVYNNERNIDYNKYSNAINLVDALTQKKAGSGESVSDNPFGSLYSKDDFSARLWEAYELKDEKTAKLLRDTAIASGGDKDIIFALYDSIWGDTITEPSDIGRSAVASAKYGLRNAK